jgi:hypothetical protein
LSEHELVNSFMFLNSLHSIISGENRHVSISRASSFGSDQEVKQQRQNVALVINDRSSLSTIDAITQPICYHPPVRTHHDQQHSSEVTR